MTRQETDDVGSGDLNVLGYFGCLLRLVPFNDITDSIYAGMVKKFECWLYFDGSNAVTVYLRKFSTKGFVFKHASDFST